jgi:hypothetical protein
MLYCHITLICNIAFYMLYCFDMLHCLQHVITKLHLNWLRHELTRMSICFMPFDAEISIARYYWIRVVIYVKDLRVLEGH